MSVKSLIIIEKIKNEIKPEKLWKLVEMLPETLESFKEDVRSFLIFLENIAIIVTIQAVEFRSQNSEYRIKSGDATVRNP
ncbi:MAG: hypothetical protein ABIJ30_13360 [bacterium]